VLAGAVVVGRSAFDIPGRRRGNGASGSQHWPCWHRCDHDFHRRVALRDLKARLLELPLAGLLGRAHERVPAYKSGGLSSYDDKSTPRAAISMGGG
jgi:hypothetical protein